MTTHKKTQQPLAALHLPRQVELLVTYAENIVARMTGNPAFTTPVPSLATVTKAIGDLRTAQAAVQARTKGTAAIRDEKRTALVTLLKQLRSYVQATADASPDNAVSIIERGADRRIGVAADRVAIGRANPWTVDRAGNVALDGGTGGAEGLALACGTHDRSIGRFL